MVITSIYNVVIKDKKNININNVVIKDKKKYKTTEIKKFNKAIDNVLNDKIK